MQDFWVPLRCVALVLESNIESRYCLQHCSVITTYLMLNRMKVLLQTPHHLGICSTSYNCGEVNYFNKESRANKADRRHLFPLMWQQIIEFCED